MVVGFWAGISVAGEVGWGTQVGTGVGRSEEGYTPHNFVPSAWAVVQALLVSWLSHLSARRARMLSYTLHWHTTTTTLSDLLSVCDLCDRPRTLTPRPTLGLSSHQCWKQNFPNRLVHNHHTHTRVEKRKIIRGPDPSSSVRIQEKKKIIFVFVQRNLEGTRICITLQYAVVSGNGYPMIFQKLIWNKI